MVLSFGKKETRNGGIMRRLLLRAAAVPLLFAAVSALAISDQDVPRMTKEELKSLLGNRDLIIFDVRSTPDYNTSNATIRGAVRVNPKAPIETWIDSYPKDRIYVFYCTWHDEATSAGLARKFIEKGYSRSYALKGGWKEWEKAGYPTEPKEVPFMIPLSRLDLPDPVEARKKMSGSLP
jgi:rhodanese-related sulfurtransferase